MLKQVFFLVLFIGVSSEMTLAGYENEDEGYPTESLAISPLGPVQSVQRVHVKDSITVSEVLWNYDQDGHLLKIHQYKPLAWTPDWVCLLHWNSDGEVEEVEFAPHSISLYDYQEHYLYDFTLLKKEREIRYSYLDIEGSLREIPVLRYQGTGNLVERNQRGKVFEYQWDEQGYLLAETFGDDETDWSQTLIRYDDQHRILEKTTYEFSPIAPPKIRYQQRYAYDDRGTLTLDFETNGYDVYGGQWENRYDDQGRLQERILRNDKTAILRHMKYEYREDNQTLTTWYYDIYGNLWNVGYETTNHKGQLMEEVDLHSHTFYTYDNLGRMILLYSTFRDSGQLYRREERTFDTQERVLIEKLISSYGSNGNSNENLDITYRYDAYGNLIEKHLLRNGDKIQNQVEQWVWTYTYYSEVPDWMLYESREHDL